MDYKIAIPSYSRSTALAKRTLKMLDYYKISPKIIYIFVVKEQLEEYKKKCGTAYNFIVGKKGVSNQRQFISNYFAEKEKVVSFDDDVEKIYQLHNEKLTILEDLNNYILNVFEELTKNNCSLSGVYPIENSYFMKDFVSYDLRYIIGQFNIYFNRRKQEIREFTLIEDYEKTLKYYMLDKKVRRDNSVCLKANTYTLKGGISSSEDRTLERKLEQIEKFILKYPKYASKKIKKKQIDIRFKKQKEKELFYFIGDLDSDCFILYDYIKNMRITANGNRKNINQGKHPLSATYGYVINGNNNGIWRPESLVYRGYYLSKLKQDYPYLEEVFREFSNLYFRELKWTNIMINKNFQTQPHRDANNIGESCIVGLGDYTGGELEVEGRGVIDIQHNPTIFNGSKLTHGTKPFNGERWSLVFFDNIISK